MPGIIRTPRLSLIPLTPALGKADLSGRETLERQLRAQVPESWPPELFETDKLEWTIRHLEQHPQEIGWWLHYVIFSPESCLAGVAGYKGPPDGDGLVEVGYSILSAFRRRGIATEATLGLADHAFSRKDVRCVMAQTLPSFSASRTVLEKAGFQYAGPGAELNIIRYELERRDWEDARSRPEPEQSGRRRGQVES